MRAANLRRLLRRPGWTDGGGRSAVFSDTRGTTAVITGLAITVLMGFAGLATDVAYWQSTKAAMHGATDRAAYSGAIAISAGTDVTTEAKAVAAQLGFVDGQNGVTVTVNNPPLNGADTGDADAVEVIISGPAKQFFSEILMGSAPNISARSVAASATGNVCMLATDTNVGDKHSFLVNGANSNVNISGCTLAVNLLNSNSTDSLDSKSGSVFTADTVYLRTATVCNGGSCPGTYNVTKTLYNQKAIDDPYKSRAIPVPSDCLGGTNLVIDTSTTLNPGNYCGTGGNAALTVTNGATPTASTKVASGTTITVSSASGISTGMAAADTHALTAIPAGTKVTGVSGTSITLSNSVTNVNSGDTLSFISGAFQTASANAAKGAKTLTVNSAAGIAVGQTVADLKASNAVSAGTTVSSISGTSITLNQALANNVNAADTLQFTTPTTVTLNPGVYILDGQGGGTCSGTTKPSTCSSGDFDVTSGSVVNGTGGVTIVLTTTSSNVINIGNMNIDDSSTLNITAPTSGTTSGMAIWQNANAPHPGNPGGGYSEGDPGVNTINGGSSLGVTGVIYMPSQGLLFTGGASLASVQCTQVVAWAIQFLHDAVYTYGNCANTGVLAMGGNPGLVE